MPTNTTVRLNLHPTTDPLRFAWALVIIQTDARGVPGARVIEHGVVDLQDPDPVGIEVVAALLARATAPSV